MYFSCLTQKKRVNEYSNDIIVKKSKLLMFFFMWKSTGKKRVTIRMSYVTKRKMMNTRAWHENNGGIWFDDIPWEFIYSTHVPLPLASYQYVSVQPISPVIHGNMMGREKRIVLVIKKNVIGKIEWFFYCFFWFVYFFLLCQCFFFFY